MALVPSLAEEGRGGEGGEGWVPSPSPPSLSSSTFMASQWWGCSAPRRCSNDIESAIGVRAEMAGGDDTCRVGLALPRPPPPPTEEEETEEEGQRMGEGRWGGPPRRSSSPSSSVGWAWIRAGFKCPGMPRTSGWWWGEWMEKL